jgi:hypothetical protein
MHIGIVTVFRFTAMFINIVFGNIILKVMKIVCICWLKLWILNYDACNGKYKKSSVNYFTSHWEIIRSLAFKSTDKYLM